MQGMKAGQCLLLSFTVAIHRRDSTARRNMHALRRPERVAAAPASVRELTLQKSDAGKPVVNKTTQPRCLASPSPFRGSLHRSTLHPDSQITGSSSGVFLI